LWIDPATPLPGVVAQTPGTGQTSSAPYADWLVLTRATLDSGRLGELIRLCDAIDGDATPDGLATTARLYEHIDEVSVADAADLARLTTRYGGFAPTCRAQKLLVERFKKTAAHRAEQLSQESSDE
ncbi:MAG: hypothetical protein KDA33_07325, partial [Phycisphaerales bacterium]|nr:hypothetical protein [Phycisphaerales bacterium]